MNTQTQEALHKALKVLNCLNNDRVYETAWVKGAINACEKALEQPAQDFFARGIKIAKWADKQNQQPAWQGLSDDEICELGMKLSNPAGEFIGLSDWKVFSRAIEQALKEKNT